MKNGSRGCTGGVLQRLFMQLTALPDPRASQGLFQSMLLWYMMQPRNRNSTAGRRFAFYMQFWLRACLDAKDWGWLG